MAQVPNPGVPTVAPNASPIPRQQINPPADAFGAGVTGTGLQQVGEALGHSADQMAAFAQQYQQLNNKQAADTAAIDYINKADAAHSTYIETNKGSMGAVTNLPDYYKSLESIRSDAATDLSPAARIDYDSATRRYAAGLRGSAVTYAAAQRSDAITKTAVASNQIALGKMANSEIGDDDWKWGLQQIGSNAASLGQLNNWGPDQARAYVQSQLSSAYFGQIQTANAQGDVPKATKILADHADEMTEPQILQARAALKVGEQSYIVNSVRMQAANGGGAYSVPGLGGPDGVKSAILNQESGNNPNATTSVTGAVGPGQIEPATFAQYAKPGEVINNPADNRRVSARIVDDYYKKYDGDAARVAVAYFSGPGNVAPAGAPHPWVKDVSDPTGKSTSAYVNDVVTRTGQSQAPALIPNLATPPSTVNIEEWQAQKIADVNGFVQTAYSGNPTQGEKVRSGLLAQIQQTGQLVGTQQKAARDNIWTFIDANHINDQGALTAAMPDSASTISALPPTMQRQIQSAMNFNANQQTPERAQNAIAIEGLKAVDPEKFLNIDPMASNLTRADQLKYAKEQQQLKGKLSSQTADPILRSALSSIEVKNALAGLQIKPNTQEFYEFAGALKADIDAATVPGKPLKSDQIGSMVQNLAYQKGRDWFGHPSGDATFKVPDDAYKAIQTAGLKKGRAYTDVDIANIYRSQTRGH